MAHKLRQIEILRKIDPSYVRCGTEMEIYPFSFNFQHNVTCTHRPTMLYFILIGLLLVKQNVLLCDGLVTINRP